MSSKGAKFRLIRLQCTEPGSVVTSRVVNQITGCLRVLFSCSLFTVRARREDMVMNANLPFASSSLRIAAGYDFCHRVSKQQMAANGHPSMQMIAHVSGCLECNLQEKQYDPMETPRTAYLTLQCCIQNSSLCNIVKKWSFQYILNILGEGGGGFSGLY